VLSAFVSTSWGEIDTEEGRGNIGTDPVGNCNTGIITFPVLGDDTVEDEAPSITLDT
jgi:hypothetical protein